MADVVEKPQDVGAGGDASNAKQGTPTKKLVEVDDAVATETTKSLTNTDSPKSETTSTTESPEKNASAEDISKLESDIIRQVEYYFGDANLRKDKFLLEQIGKDEDGWVPFTVLLTFKRLSSICTDVDAIVSALMKSDEGLVEISEDKLKIRRHPEKPIPEYNEERRKEITSRTAYAKGFPLDAEMSDLIDFFNPFDKVVNIVMRKYLDKASKAYKFKGSVFVTFAKKEQCESFINKEKVEYKEKDLIRKSQEQYFEEKKKEERGSKKKAKQSKEDEKYELPKGAILHFEGCDENTKRENIREGLEKLVAEIGAEIAFIEYSKGDKTGFVRLTTGNSAQSLLDKFEDKKLKLNESVELVFRTLTEEEEKDFLKKAVEHMKSRRNQPNRNKGNRKRRASDKDKDKEEEPVAKQKN